MGISGGGVGAGFQENCGVENYGNSAGAFAKRAMRISFKGEYGATSLDYPIYEGYDHGLRPVTKFDTIDFRAGEHDMRQRGFYMGNIFADDMTLDSFTYDGALPWPQGADGGGYSLSRVLPANIAAIQPAAWRNSTTIGGNPAGSDAVSFTGVAASDGDFDALPALVEHALGTNPASNTSAPGALVAGVDVTGRLTLTFPHNLLAEDVSCLCETSEDLVTWTPGEILTRVNTGSTASETWRSATPSGPTQFIRLRVTKP